LKQSETKDQTEKELKSRDPIIIFLGGLDNKIAKNSMTKSKVSI
jgi:hypothetical protein